VGAAAPPTERAVQERYLAPARERLGAAAAREAFEAGRANPQAFE
jgi:hypothetical protein